MMMIIENNMIGASERALDPPEPAAVARPAGPDLRREKGGNVVSTGRARDREREREGDRDRDRDRDTEREREREEFAA